MLECVSGRLGNLLASSTLQMIAILKVRRGGQKAAPLQVGTAEEASELHLSSQCYPTNTAVV